MQGTGFVGPGPLPLIFGLLGGLALFLFGMGQMAEALKFVAGDRMRSILARLTRNRVAGVFTGALVTAIIQSSSVTTVLVVGFISAGIMTLGQSVGVILGADIGTTITAQIIAFNIKEYSLLLVAVGFLALFLARREMTRQIGAAIMGLGMVFLGMGIMGEAMRPLRTWPPFLDLMTGLRNPWLGILIGALFTALVQASAATVGIIIVLGSQGLLSLPAGIGLLLGANIGTTVTALLASIGRPREARRAAVIHLIFKVVGVLIWVFLIPELIWMTVRVSPAHPELAGVARLAAETPRQIANAHTLFNVANTLLFLPFGGAFVWLVRRLVPDRKDGDHGVQIKYLDYGLLRTPAFALDRARLEMLNMGDRVGEMLKDILPAVVKGDREELGGFSARDDEVDRLHGEIVTYLGRVSQETLTAGQTEELMKLLEATNDLENIGDVIETNLVRLGRSRLDDGVHVSEATTGVLEEFHAAVSRALDMALLAVSQKNESAAAEVVGMKGEINRLASSAAIHEAHRLVAHEPGRLPTYTFEVDVLESLKRVYYFAKRMARAALPSVDLRTEKPS
ncbi:MAG: Na/Pi cotransporter family protein [Candidatus Palauibacterales bacterium]|jgi:phosphate:Na+ symporter|nr:Na/Pi cotransporter family protein [Candidatus Palauibacterales bacterium]